MFGRFLLIDFGRISIRILFYFIFLFPNVGSSYDDIQDKQDSMNKIFIFIFCDIHIWDFKTSNVK